MKIFRHLLIVGLAAFALPLTQSAIEKLFGDRHIHSGLGEAIALPK